MKTTLLHSLHEKAMKTIEAIKKAETKRKGHVETAYSYGKHSSHFFSDAIRWQEHRAEVNAAIAARLRVSYNRIIQKILLHKP